LQKTSGSCGGGGDAIARRLKLTASSCFPEIAAALEDMGDWAAHRLTGGKGAFLQD